MAAPHDDTHQLLMNANSDDMHPVKAAAGKGAFTAPLLTNYGAVASPANMQMLQQILKDSRLPQTLVQRLAIDSFPPPSSATYCRVNNYSQLQKKKPNSSYCGNTLSCCFCRWGTLIQEGEVGVVREDAEYSLLDQGYHTFVNFGTEYMGRHRLNVMDVPVTYGACGFVVISEGRIGLLQDGSEYRILAPGMYQWSSPTVRFLASADTCTRQVDLGPYTLITVPDGHVCTSFNNGDLVVLGWNETNNACSDSRTYFLNDPKWTVGTYLPTQTQTDKLPANDLLTKDNVEILMVAMSQWRIVDPRLAVQRCGETMDKIREKVNQIVRATIARIVASTSIGAGPVSGSVSKPIVQAQVAQPANTADGHPANTADGLAQLMQSAAANQHMSQLRENTEQMGIEVIAIFVPEKRMKNDDIRNQVASQAVIGIQAEAERSAADATAYATVKRATAEAESIQLLAKAHADAGAKLGAPDTTAARLALTEVTAKSLSNAKVTLFSGAPGNMPFLLTDK